MSPVVALKSKSLGALVDEINAVREKRRAVEAEKQKLAEQYDSLEALIREALIEQGLDSAKGKTAVVSFGAPMQCGRIVDMEALGKYIKRTGYFQLFQKRVSDPALREIMALKGGVVPGIEVFEKQTLYLKSL